MHRGLVRGLVSVLAGTLFVVALCSLRPSACEANSAGVLPPLLFMQGGTDRVWVDPARGDDSAAGTVDRPLRTISKAVSLVPDWLDVPVAIELAPGAYAETGALGMPSNSLFLSRRMACGGSVTIVGDIGPNGERPILAWESGRDDDSRMVDVREGDWRIENVQIGTFTTEQRRGAYVVGPGCLTLKDVTFRLRSPSSAGIHADRGGLIILRGAIRLNEQLHEAAEDETFSGIVAEYGGVVQFKGDRAGALLEIGNGSLSAKYYGVIELGCERARITSWAYQANCLAVNNSGRVDLHSTETTLCARNPKNTPVGLEDDGHILAEGAHLVIDGQGNGDGIVLQKASTFFCNDIELRGTVHTAFLAMSGSVGLAGFLGDVPEVRASTGAHITIERVDGKLVGPVHASGGASIDLPDGTVVRE
jgi:hypothetical protein